MKKIVFFGNVTSSSIIVKQLRDKTKYEPDLLLQDYNSIFDHPAWDEVHVKIPEDITKKNIQEAKNILNNVIEKEKWIKPNWIKEHPIKYSLYDKVTTKYFDHNHNLKKQINHYVNDLKKYDFVVTDGFGAISALFAKVPYVIRPYGSDIDILPFEKNYRGKLIKKAFQNAKAILMTHDTKNLEKLEIEKKHKSISVIIDTENFKPQPEKPKNSKEFFLAARLDFNGKGTDKVIYAFAKIVKTCKSHLFCLKRGIDAQRAENLVIKLDLKNHVTFYNFVASKPVLNDLFNTHDAIIGDLGSGHIGLTELEAMACNKPVIANTEIHSDIEEEMPIMNCYTEDEIYSQMMNVCKNEHIPTGMRDFVIKNFGYEKYFKIFDSIINSC